MLSVYEIGEKIAVARKLRNLSQAQLAECLSISAQAVGKWERGESMPDIITFGRLAEVLGVDLNYFAGAQSPPPDSRSAPDSAPADEDSSAAGGWDMSSANWIDADFSGLRGLAERFKTANIENCKFVDSELSGLFLKSNNIRRCDFTRSDMKNCRFSTTNLENDVFAGCDLTRSCLTSCSLKNCDFSCANLTDAVFKWCQIQSPKLSGALLHGTSFKSGQINGVTLDGIISYCAFENFDFARTEFHGAVIRNSFFKNCKMKRAKFTACKADRITYAFLKSSKADMSGVELIDE